MCEAEKEEEEEEWEAAKEGWERVAEPAWAPSGVWALKEGRVKVGGWAAPPLFVLLDRESEIRIPESSRNLSRRDAQQPHSESHSKFHSFNPTPFL